MSNIAETTGRIHSVESFGALDGPGIRYVVFLQGCLLRCAYCHNPDTWDCGDGTSTTAGEVVEKILPFRNFIRSGGVTLSGGEPLMQPEFAAAILQLCKEQGFHTAVDTSGAVPMEKCREALELADLLLLDIKALDPEDCRKLTGMDNTNALRLLQWCEEVGKPVWIRHVCVPGVTLVEEKLKKLASYLTNFTCIKKIELLPFHKMGAYKWETMQIPFEFGKVEEPTNEQMERSRNIFITFGLPI